MTNEIKKYYEGLDCAICEEKEPCIYKIANELQEKITAKEQECERLKRDYFKQNEWLQEQKNELDKLKTENEELKKQVNITQMFLDACNNSCEYYKQTLTEIKEIIKFNKTNRLSGGACISIEQILQKISDLEV